MRSLAIAAHELRTLRGDPGPAVILVVMPLLAIAFIAPAYRPLLAAEGYPGASGAEQAVPGMAAMFAAFLAGVLGFSILREHVWGTWDRLRASSISTVELLAGKALVPLGIAAVQQAVLFGTGILLLGLRVRGSAAALVLLDLGLATCLLAFGVALAAVCRSGPQLNALDRVASMVFAAVGGALVPLPALPSWAQAVAPATPTYWAMRGFRAVILDGGDMGSIVLPVLALAGFTAIFGVVALTRFRFDETRITG